MVGKEWGHLNKIGKEMVEKILIVIGKRNQSNGGLRETGLTFLTQ